MLVPLTLPTCLHLTAQQDSPTNATEQSFIDEPCSRIIAWCSDESSGSLGAAVGSKFGSVYLFGTPLPGEPTSKTSPPSLSRTRFPTLTTAAHSGHRASSPPSSSGSRPQSRRHSGYLQSPSSLSLNQALIKPSARSRVVSGVSCEQVQASKSSVDFEDESERLKDLLKSSAVNRSTRERSIVDTLLPSFEKGVVIERTSPLSPSPFLPSSTLSPVSPGSIKGRDDPKSLLSATNSPLFIPRSLSAPPSPHLPTLNDKTEEESLALIAHILPPRCGLAHGVADLIIPEGTDLLVSLQESGYALRVRGMKVTHACFSDVSVFDTHDGICIAAARCRKAVRSRNDTSCWTRLRTVRTGEVSIQHDSPVPLSAAFHRMPTLSWLVPHTDLPIRRFSAFLIRLMRMRGSMHVIHCLNSTSGTLTISTLHGLNHWVIGSSTVSPRLPI